MSEAPLYCTATRNDGEPCRGYATKTGMCAGHSKLGAVSDPQANATKSAEVRQAKAAERSKTLLDRIAERLEKRADNIIDAYENAGNTGDWRAWEALITRHYGKPIERVEQLDPGAANVASLSREQREELRRQLVSENPGLLELVPKVEAA